MSGSPEDDDESWFRPVWETDDEAELAPPSPALDVSTPVFLAGRRDDRHRRQGGDRPSPAHRIEYRADAVLP